MKLLRPTENL